MEQLKLKKKDVNMSNTDESDESNEVEAVVVDDWEIDYDNEK